MTMHDQTRKSILTLLKMIERLDAAPAPYEVGRVQGQAIIVKINVDEYEREAEEKRA